MSGGHYETLGVGRDADLKKIKGAYRKKAKELHPDTSASKVRSEEFLHVEEAYEVLSDRKKRRQYDEELDRKRTWAGESRMPVRDVGDAVPFALDPVSSFDEFLFSGFDEGPAHHYRVILSPYEAARGVSCPLSYTAFGLCPRCGGRTLFDVFLCSYCRGAGMLEREREIVLEIPAGVRHGTSLRLKPNGAVLTVEILIGQD
jgi:molecular chaperone DnaJ